jgi:lipoprotein-releasing system permease protein
MIATQKMAEIAMLKAMGAANATIGGAFLFLGATLGTLGVLAGVSGGVCGALALRRWGYALDPDVFYLTQLPVRIDGLEIIAVGIAGILITMLGTVQPAWIAARLTPVEGLREGGH